MIVARIALQGEEHLAIAFSLEDRLKIQAGEITSLDLDKVFSEHLPLLLAFDKKMTKIAFMSEEVLSQRIASLAS